MNTRNRPTLIPWQVGKGIARATLMVCAAYLEVHGNKAGGLWMLITLWVIFGEWK